MPDYALSRGNSFNLSLLQAGCVLQNRGIVAVSTTQASVTRVHRDGLEHRKKLFQAFFHKKKPKKNVEKPQSNLKSSVSSGGDIPPICAIICQMSLRRVGVKRVVTFSPANADMELLRQIFIKSRPKLPVVSLSGANLPRQTGRRGRNQADIRWNGDNNRRSRPW